MADIVTLTINPSVDIFVSVDKVEPTAKMRCSSPKRDPGGGGINVARVAYRLGSDVSAIYPVGGALGKLLQTHRFNSAEDLSKTLHRYVWLYNQHLPQKALNHETPLMALKRWQESHPHLFKKKVANHPGPDR